MNNSNLIGGMIAASARLGIGYADRLMTGLTQENYARFATAGDRPIESNHPCFILGHLSLYPCRVVEQLGGDASSIVPTEAFDKLFNKDAKCVDDAGGDLYPSLESVVEAFRGAHDLAISTLEQTPNDAFDAENPNEGMRAKFPTIAAMHGFYLGGHLMIHMGQLSAWRRAMGMAAA